MDRSRAGVSLARCRDWHWRGVFIGSEGSRHWATHHLRAAPADTVEVAACRFRAWRRGEGAQCTGGGGVWVGWRYG